MSYVEGFDCAWPQGGIRWDEVPAKYKFIIAQIANGVACRDPTGPVNIAGAKRTGRICGVYLFFSVGADPEAEVENAWQACGKEVPHFFAIDFETLSKGFTPTQAIERLRAAVAAARARFGAIPVLVYTYPNFATQVIGSVLAAATDLAEQAELWMADYGKGESVDGKSPVIVKPWSDWKLWQTSGNNSTFIPGVNGHVDHDVFNGTEDEMRAWLGLNGQGEVDTVVPAPVEFTPREYDGEPD